MQYSHEELEKMLRFMNLTQGIYPVGKTSYLARAREKKSYEATNFNTFLGEHELIKGIEVKLLCMDKPPLKCGISPSFHERFMSGLVELCEASYILSLGRDANERTVSFFLSNEGQLYYGTKNEKESTVFTARMLFTAEPTMHVADILENIGAVCYTAESGILTGIHDTLGNSIDGLVPSLRPLRLELANAITFL